MRYLTFTTNALVVGFFSYGVFRMGWHRQGLPYAFLALWITGNLVVWTVFRARRHRGGLKGVERRSSLRVIYSPATRPRLQVEGHTFAVADLSQHGLRLINDGIHMTRPVRGTLTFSDGQTVDISGTVGWQEANETSLLLEELIPLTTISKEFHHLSPVTPDDD